MADTIKIGSLDISAFKVGSSDCKIYLGDTLLYPQSPTPPTPTYQWVSYNEGDAIPSESVYKTYGLRISTQAVYDIVENGKYLEIQLNSEEQDQQLHPVSFIVFSLYAEGVFFYINGSSQEISYDPSSDEYLEIIFSDYGVDYNYDVGYFTYGDEGDTSRVFDFPIDMYLYEEYTPTPQTLQWVTFSNGDTIPSDLQIYGIKGTVNDLSDAFTGYEDDIYVEDESHNMYGVHIGGYSSGCYEETGIAYNTSVEYIFSNIGCSDSYTVSSHTIVYMSNDIQLLIYA